MINHSNCGAYAEELKAIGINQSEEREFHIDQLDQFQEIFSGRYPTIEIEKYFINLKEESIGFEVV